VKKQRNVFGIELFGMGIFSDEKNLFQQLGRYNQLDNNNRIGIIGRDDNNYELSRLKENILKTAGQ
jgi:hypothetical protein